MSASRAALFVCACSSAATAPKVLVAVVGEVRGGPLAWYSLIHHVVRPLDATLALQTASPVPLYLEEHATYIWPDIRPSAHDGSLYRVIDALLGGVNASATLNNTALPCCCLINDPTHRATGLTQWVTLELLYRNLRAWGLLQAFDQLVLTRFDHAHVAPHPRLDPDTSVVYVPHGQDFGGTNDRHAVFHMSQARRLLRPLHFIFDEVGPTHASCMSTVEAFRIAHWRSSVRQLRSERTMFLVKLSDEASGSAQPEQPNSAGYRINHPHGSLAAPLRRACATIFSWMSAYGYSARFYSELRDACKHVNASDLGLGSGMDKVLDLKDAAEAVDCRKNWDARPNIVRHTGCSATAALLWDPNGYAPPSRRVRTPMPVGTSAHLRMWQPWHAAARFPLGSYLPAMNTPRAHDLEAVHTTLERVVSGDSANPYASKQQLACNVTIVAVAAGCDAPLLAQLDSKRSDGRWCAVFVASVSANPSLECNLRNSRVTWLSTNRMQVLPYLSVTVTPWASDAGRKNIGYLYALAEGAHVLLDADAMAQYRLEELWDSALRPARPRSLCRAAPSGSSTGFANLLPLFGLSRSEHRAGPVADDGAPVTTCQETDTRGGIWGRLIHHAAAPLHVSWPPVLQSMGCSEASAIHPCTPPRPAADFKVVVTAPSEISPYSAHGSLHRNVNGSLCASMPLPVTVPSSTADVWRSLIAHRVLQRQHPHQLRGLNSTHTTGFVPSWQSGETRRSSEHQVGPGYKRSEATDDELNTRLEITSVWRSLQAHPIEALGTCERLTRAVQHLAHVKVLRWPDVTLITAWAKDFTRIMDARRKASSVMPIPQTAAAKAATNPDLKKRIYTLPHCNVGGFAVGSAGTRLRRLSRCPTRAPCTQESLTFPMHMNESSAVRLTWQRCSTVCADAGAPFFDFGKFADRDPCTCGWSADVDVSEYNDGWTAGSACSDSVAYECSKIFRGPHRIPCPSGGVGRQGWCCTRIPPETTKRLAPLPRRCQDMRRPLPEALLPLEASPTPVTPPPPLPPNAVSQQPPPIPWCLPSGTPSLPPSYHADDRTPPGLTVHCDTDLEWSRALSPGMPSAWSRVLRKLHEGRSVTILTLGGSMTAGAQCEEVKATGGAPDGPTFAGRQCAWSHRFVLWLRRAFPRAEICHVNSARAGSDSEVALGSLYSLLRPHGCGGGPVDVVFTDYSVNDALGASTQGAADLTSKSSLQSLPREKQLGVVMEALILAIKKLAPDAMHVQLLQQIVAGFQSKSLHAMRRACVHHGVAIVDLNHACNSLIACEWSPATNHPQWQSHQHVANAVAYAFRRADQELLLCNPSKPRPAANHAQPVPAMRCDSARPVTSELAARARRDWFNHAGYCIAHPPFGRTKPAMLTRFGYSPEGAALDLISLMRLAPMGVTAAGTLHSPLDLEKATVCLAPTSEISAYLPPSATAAMGRDLGGTWKLFEDRPGKPGWIASVPHATHRFNVTFGAKPALGISYLRSYSSVGNAQITLNGVTDSLVGYWVQPLSTTQTAWFQADSKSLGFGVEPYSSHVLEIKFLGGAVPRLRGVYHRFDANGELQGQQLGCLPPSNECKFKLIEILAC